MAKAEMSEFNSRDYSQLSLPLVGPGFFGRQEDLTAPVTYIKDPEIDGYLIRHPKARVLADPMDHVRWSMVISTPIGRWLAFLRFEDD